MEIETVKLEDNLEYNILDIIEIDNTKYVYLSESGNEKNFCIRKLVNQDQDLMGLDNDEEFDKALEKFTDKYKDIFIG